MWWIVSFTFNVGVCPHVTVSSACSASVVSYFRAAESTSGSYHRASWTCGTCGIQSHSDFSCRTCIDQWSWRHCWSVSWTLSKFTVYLFHLAIVPLTSIVISRHSLVLLMVSEMSVMCLTLVWNVPILWQKWLLCMSWKCAIFVTHIFELIRNGRCLTSDWDSPCSFYH